MQKILTLLLAGLLATTVIAQNLQNPWTDANEAGFASGSNKRQTPLPTKYRTLSLDLDLLKANLKNAPMRSVSEGENAQVTLSIPMPDGTMQDFQMVEAPVMHPDLAAKYPYIRSYAGWSRKDRTAYLRCGYTQKGFHAVVLSAKHSTVYVDAFAEGDDRHYMSYFKEDYPTDESGFECSTKEHPKIENLLSKAQDASAVGVCNHWNLELALSCTGEFSAFHGGTKPLVMAALNEIMTRVNAIFEREKGLTMTMVPNNDYLIFLDPSTDPFSGANNYISNLGQNQTTCDDIIGNSNYDLGHVLFRSNNNILGNGSGAAEIESPCVSGIKARAASGHFTPTASSPAFINVICHEMGHQFGANHTQNNEGCNEVEWAAVEPGSGSTIMSYAGLCHPNVQMYEDDYFHYRSLSEMAYYASCSEIIASDNIDPIATVGQTTFDIPISTPFVLTGVGTDANPADVLTYCWEQNNASLAPMPPKPTNVFGPAFRSLPPTNVPYRYFPNLPDVLANISPTWEVLPSVARSMFFRLTVRDNHFGAGCVDVDGVLVNFKATAGPFLVASPNTADIIWTGNTTTNVTWDVANTNLPPISTNEVEILLSTDGGLSFAHTLLDATENDGEATVLVPNIPTTAARIIVRAKGNIYFDVSNQDFRILVPRFELQTNPNTAVACQNGQADYALDITQFDGFAQPINFTVSGLPAGATAVFSPNGTVPPANVVLTVANLSGAAPGTYNLSVSATGGVVNRASNLTLVIPDQITAAPALTAPFDGAELTDIQPILSWNTVADAYEYLVEVSASPSFSSLYASGIATSTSLQLPIKVAPLGVYYWRVRGKNPCSEGAYSQVYAFHIGSQDCQTFTATGLPLAIPNLATTISKTIMAPANFSISDVKVSLNISHSFIGHLSASLTSPQGTALQVFDKPGAPASVFGCSANNIVAEFTDSFSNSAMDFENTCSSVAPAISGNFQPMTPFSTVKAENAMGDWVLNITDHQFSESGNLNSWVLELCGLSLTPSAVLLKNNALSVPQGQGALVSQSQLWGSGNPSNEVIFTILSSPMNGSLLRSNIPLSVGGSFTQADIDGGLISYQHNGSFSNSDGFVFDLLDNAGNWLHSQSFQINVLSNSVSAIASITNSISCAGAMDGQIMVSASGGTAPFQYNINGSAYQTSNTFGNLAAGNYTVQVKDANGQPFTIASLSLQSPPQLVVSASTNSSTITAMGSGGTGNLTYSIGGTFQGNNLFANLPNGTYTITVMDANGCTASTSASVLVNSVIVSANVTAQVSCFGGNDGEITANATGGLAPYQYSLNGGAYQASNLFGNLAAGSYTISTMDADGLMQTSPAIVVAAPPQLMGTATVSGYTVSVAASGGTGSWYYSLDGGAFQMENSFSPVANGNHSITLHDANGCEYAFEVTVTVPDLEVDGMVSQPIKCPGGMDGQLTAMATGGVPPYEYSLNGGTFQSESNFADLAEGDYTLTIKDSGGFTISSSNILLVAPPALVVNADVAAQMVTISSNGGTPPYRFQLDAGPLQSTNTFIGVSVGTHIATVVDAHGCQQTVGVAVGVMPPSVFVLQSQLLACFGGSDAALTVNAGGGVEPYQYSLNGSPSQASNVFTGLAAGSYTVSVIGADGGTTTSSSIVINEPPALGVSASAFGFAITAMGMGGTGSYLFSIDGVNFGPENEFEVVENGSYTIIIQDENGCMASTAVSVNAITGGGFSATSIDCFGNMNGQYEVLYIEGGVPPFTYSLNGGAFTSQTIYLGLSAGIYTLQVMDALGFVYNAPNLTIAQPSAPVLASFQLTINDLAIVATGGFEPYMYSIDGGLTFQGGQVFNDLPIGTYMVVVKDAAGCTFEGQVAVTVNATGEQLGDLQFEVTPNPSDGLFLLKMQVPNLSDFHLAVYDVVGKRVFASQLAVVGGQQVPLDLTALTSGTYFLWVRGDEVSGVKKLEIMR